jgi:hypothetical protein
LRAAGIDAMELEDTLCEESVLGITIHRALLQVGYLRGMRTALQQDGELTGRLYTSSCARLNSAREATSLRSNLTASNQRSNRELRDSSRAHELRTVTSMLYGRRIVFDSLVCGHLQLNSDGAADALKRWLGPAKVAAVFNVGHVPFMHFDDGNSSRLLERDGALQPSPELTAEAARFVAATPLGRAPRFVAAHWRAGEYVAYGNGAPLESLTRAVRTMLSRESCAGDGADAPPACPVFLMTNCRDASTLAKLRAALPTVLTYEPAAGTRFVAEGARDTRFVSTRFFSLPDV